MKGVGDVSVDLDQEVLLGGELLVTKLDALLDPGSEVLSDNAVGHVQDPLLLQPFSLEL